MKDWADCSAAERIERWVNVERVLVALPAHEREKHFDMSRWGYVNDCGTVGCAAGLCSLDDWFRDRGWSGIYVPIHAKDLGYWVVDGFRNVVRELRLDDGSFEGDHMGSWISTFFGPTESGRMPYTRRIFTNEAPRSVDTVIEEVRGRIAELRDQYGVVA